MPGQTVATHFGVPAAFNPIEVTDTDTNFYGVGGKLSGPAFIWMRGILNNKPFTSTIAAIAGRTATRDVERFLIYVEPSPERFERNASDPLVPTLVEAAFNSLVSNSFISEHCNGPTDD